MYKCAICHECSEPRQALRKHTFYRTVPCTATDPNTGRGVMATRQEIAREVPVCPECAIALRTTSYVRLVNTHRIAQGRLSASQLPKVTPTTPRGLIGVPGASSPLPGTRPLPTIFTGTTSSTPLRGLAAVVARGAPVMVQCRPSDKKHEAPPREVPSGACKAQLCDVCGDRIVGGTDADAQRTSDTVLCKECASHTRRKSSES